MRMSRNDARKWLDIRPDAQLVLFVGRLVEQKDPYVLLRAIALLRQSGTFAYCRFSRVTVGRGMPAEQEAQRLGLGENGVRFLGNCANVGDI